MPVYGIGTAVVNGETKNLENLIRVLSSLSGVSVNTGTKKKLGLSGLTFSGLSLAAIGYLKFADLTGSPGPTLVQFALLTGIIGFIFSLLAIPRKEAFVAIGLLLVVGYFFLFGWPLYWVA